MTAKRKTATLTFAAAAAVLAGFTVLTEFIPSAARAGTLAPDSIKAASKKLGFPIVRGTVVYCVDPQTGSVDQMAVVDSSEAVSCPGDDTFFITQKSAKFIEVAQ